MMKMIFRLFMVALLCLAFAGPASAAILNSKHDFSSDSAEVGFAVAGEDRMCVFCHTPHNAVENVPLWNRTVGAAGQYDLYTSSATLTSATKASVITNLNISYKCLSCHDGTVSIGGGAVRGTSAGMDADTNTVTGLTQIAGGGNNLTDDHPIGFDYDRILNGGLADDKFNILTVVTADGLKFYNAGAKVNQMECATCHDVHGQGTGAPAKFLRTSNAGSDLCLTCHIK